MLLEECSTQVAPDLQFVSSVRSVKHSKGKSSTARSACTSGQVPCVPAASALLARTPGPARQQERASVIRRRVECSHEGF